MMSTVRYLPELTGAVVLQELRRRLAAGDDALFRRYHALTDPLYEAGDPGTRARGFAEVHARLFRELGFEAAISATLGEFPLVAACVSRTVIGPAIGAHEEGADLIERAGGAGTRDGLGLRIRPERFLDPAALESILHHELQHAADLLDPRFGHDGSVPFGARSPMEERILRNRYRILWDISVDGRLTRAGKRTVASREERARQFEAWFGELAPRERRLLFERLWHGEVPTHTALLEIARQGGTSAGLLTPGSRCPLCGFPMYRMVRPDDFTPDIALRIQGDFPEWQVEAGACARCLDAYAVRARRA